MRLTRFRSTALEMFFLAITKPSRGHTRLPGTASTSRCWQETLKRAFLKTGLKSEAPSRRRFLPNLNSDTESTCVSAAGLRIESLTL